MLIFDAAGDSGFVCPFCSRGAVLTRSAVRHARPTCVRFEQLDGPEYVMAVEHVWNAASSGLAWAWGLSRPAPAPPA